METRNPLGDLNNSQTENGSRSPSDAAGGNPVKLSDASADAGMMSEKNRENNRCGSGNDMNNSGCGNQNGKIRPLTAKISNIFKKILKIIKNTWVGLKEWFSERNLSRIDKWAMFVCLLCSFTIWLYVMNTDDTSYEKSIANVNVVIEGSSSLNERGMSVISGFDNVVTVTLKGRRSDIAGLSAGDINAYVDVSDIAEAGRYTLPVKVELPKNSSLVLVEPSSLSATIDIDASVNIKIEVKLNYVSDASYTVGIPELNYEYVTVTGSKTVLDKISYAAAVFNTGVITTSLTLSGSISLYNEYNQIIDSTSLKMSVTNIIVKVPVTIRKTVPVKVAYTNGIGLNYNTSISPAEITLVGDPQILSGINEVTVYTINCDMMAVGVPFVTVINSIDSLPSGVVWEDSEHGIIINSERLY
jgi:YbbR domain-containing protein